MANNSLPKHLRFLFLLESDRWTFCSIFLAMINCNIKLQFQTVTRECDSLALGASWWMFWEDDVGSVCGTSIIECREDLDICEENC